MTIPLILETDATRTLVGLAQLGTALACTNTVSWTQYISPTTKTHTSSGANCTGHSCVAGDRPDCVKVPLCALSELRRQLSNNFQQADFNRHTPVSTQSVHANPVREGLSATTAGDPFQRTLHFFARKRAVQPPTALEQRGVTSAQTHAWSESNAHTRLRGGRNTLTSGI